MAENHIYMDHGASTPVDPQVIEAMLPYWTENYGNPASSHRFGRLASRGLEEARRLIAGLVNARPGEIVFTGCGSESDNLALRGVMWAARAAGRGNHLIVSAIEHMAVLDTARQLRDHFGFELTVLPVDEYGRIELAELERALRPDTALVSIMAANNEIGTLQPVEAIGRLAHDHGALFHTDAVQAAGVRAWDMAELPLDLVSFAPHKFYGPKGVGVLIVREGIELVSSLTGGGQEDGRRAGTVNVAFAAGAAEALRLAVERRAEDVAHYQRLRDRLVDGILATAGDDCLLTGHPAERLPGHASFAFRHLSGNDLLIQLDMAGISASSGSACMTGNPKPAAVLEAIGLGPEWTTGGLRLTVGRQNTAEDVERVITAVARAVTSLKQFMSVAGLMA
jgi:cysteine desulfurase